MATHDKDKRNEMATHDKDKRNEMTANNKANVVWLAGWYATRLHAMPDDMVPSGSLPEQSLCGEYVYGKAPTEWAQRKIDKGVPHCKRCEALLKRK